MYRLTIMYEQKNIIGYTDTNKLTLEFDSRSEMLNFAEIAMRHHMEERMRIEIELIEKGEKWDERKVNENPDKAESTKEPV